MVGEVESERSTFQVWSRSQPQLVVDPLPNLISGRAVREYRGGRCVCVCTSSSPIYKRFTQSMRRAMQSMLMTLC